MQRRKWLNPNVLQPNFSRVLLEARRRWPTNTVRVSDKSGRSETLFCHNLLILNESRMFCRIP